MRKELTYSVAFASLFLVFIVAAFGGSSARAAGGTPLCPEDPWTATSPPVLSGLASTGGTLRTSNGVWPFAGSATIYRYSWFRDGVAITGATSSSYVVTSADVGKSLYAHVTAEIRCIKYGTSNSDTFEVGDQIGAPTAVIADDTQARYLLGDDGAYHLVPDDDTAYQRGLYWCNAESDWCGATHYSTAGAFPSPAGGGYASCGCQFWVELPSTLIYQYDDGDGAYHQIPDSATAAAIGLSQCGTDWCGVHHDASLPGSEGAPMPAITALNSTDSLGVSQGTHKANRFDQVRRFDSPANGARARWMVRYIASPDYVRSASHANHTLWVGANGKDPQTTWVEVGTLAGSQDGDFVNNWTYYSARGINCPKGQCRLGGPGIYQAINFSNGAPELATTHMFAAFYSGNSFNVNIDGVRYASWPTVKGPTIEYDVGFEATCATACSAFGPDEVDRTYVSKLQSRRARDGKWITSDHGSLISLGTGSGSGIAWCTQPFSFRDWLNYAGDTSLCG